MKTQRIFWRRDFKKSDQLYLLDGARVIYDSSPGFVYEHRMIRDNMPILELNQSDFLGFPPGETCQVSLDSLDKGLFSFPEVQFFKAGEKISSFAELDKKSVSFEIPQYDDYLIRVRVRGSGKTRLLSLSADVSSLAGLIFNGDIPLSENIALKELNRDSKELLVSFSKDLHYLEAEFFTRACSQVHFASKNGDFDNELILDYLLKRPEKILNIFQAKPELLSKLRENDRIAAIE